MLISVADPNALNRTPAFFPGDNRGQRLTLLLLFFAMMSAPSMGQNIANPQSAVDNLMRSDLHVDPATGALQLQIPLGEFRGRGDVSVPVVLNYSSKVWDIKYISTTPCSLPGNNGEPVSAFLARYAENSTSGWTSRIGWSFSRDQSLEFYDQRTQKPSSQSAFLKRIARQFVTGPDGSRHEVRLDDTVHNLGDNLAGRYYAVDGSRLWLDRTDSGNWVIFLPNGSRTNGSQYIDRNGNFLTRTDSWTDTLGRPLSIPIPATEPAAGDYPYTLPGGMTYILRWRNLADARTDPLQELRYKGDRTNANCSLGGFQPNHLFSSMDEQQKLQHGTIHNPVVLWQIGLPNETNYTFTYNVYGEIDKIVYPTGGSEVFSYAIKEPLGGQLDDGTYSQANRGVTSRVVSDGITTPQLWYYGAGYEAGVDPLTAMRSVKQPDGTVTKTWYYKSRGVDIKFGFDDARTGMEREKRVYDSSGTILLRRKLWQVAMDGPQTGGYPTATRNARVTKTVEIILDTGGDALAAATEMTYDADLNMTSTKRYDYVSISQASAQTSDIPSIPNGTLIRTEETDYLTSDADYRAKNLLALPTASRVKEGDNIVAQSSTSYDEATRPPLPCGAVVGWSDPGAGVVRGLPTTTASWLSTNNTWLESHAQYDECGSVRKIWDARDTALTNPTQIEYSAAYQFAYPTLNTSPDPDGSGPLSSLITSTEYDGSTGLVTATIDANGQRTTLAYNDPLNRLKQVIRAATDDSVKTQTSYTYDDTAHTVTTTSDLNVYNDNLLKTVLHYDGLGRTNETRQYEDGTNYIAVQQQYDIMGRAFMTSNPYRQTETPVWTTAVFDALGRMLTVTTPDSAVVSTAYSGNQVLVTDQSSRQRMSKNDALGRLTDVWEITVATDPASEAVSFPTHSEVEAGYRTIYSYNSLDALVGVTQQIATTGTSQTRSFAYDSLSRLTSATNPESGTFSYQYDSNGNLTQKTDSRVPAVSTTYLYDALNRAKTRSYSDGTPATTYTYDETQVNNSRGRLTSVSSDISSYRYGDYDGVGHVLIGTQITAGIEYTMRYEYDLAGNLTSQEYPSGKVVTTEFNASGRVAGVKNHVTGAYYAGDATNKIQYSAGGGVSAFKLGNGLWEHVNVNSRMQTTQIGLGISSTDASKLKLDYTYGVVVNGILDPFKNNGNMQAQTITLPGLVLTQSYEYDELNRLKVAQERSGETQSWQQTFTYDRFGNRNLVAGNTTLPQISEQNEAITNPAINPTNNRISTAGYRYDEVGNLECDPSHPCGATTPFVAYYTYSGENLLKTAGGATVGSTYFYDGNGQRVKKVVSGATTITTVFVYNIMGQLVAEYSDRGSTGGGTNYLTSDSLGTPRVITGANQEVKSRHDYLPFGEEISSNYGGRSSVPEYGPDTVTQKFTSKERDIETGLDYFLARYYSSTQGRFTSPDPILIMKQKLLDPQQWNMYGYARSNPVRYVDPSGMYICSDGAKCDSESDKAFEAARQRDLLSSDKKVRQAAQAYGGPTVDNKVYVGFAAKQAGEGGEVSFGVGKDGKYDGTLHVTFSQEQMTAGSTGGQYSLAALDITVAHEGQHVRDDKNLIDHGYDPKYIITHREAERRAYDVSERVIETIIDPKTGGHKYNPEWQGSKAIDKYLDANPLYHNLDTPIIDTSKIPQKTKPK